MATLADEEDARRAIAAARRAFVTFGQTTKEERLKILRRLHETVSARVDDLTAAMVEEYGGVVRFADLIVRAGASAFLAAEKALQELELHRSWGGTTVTLEPVGVAGLITPWNADTFFLCAKLASAVAAGCTAVMKPSELSPLQTQAWLECVHAAGLPKGLCNVVTGRGDVVGAELVRNPDVAKISFTGSAAIGRSIMRDGAATMKRVTLELGGKSPNILLDDAPFDRAIPASLGIAFLNSGQACAAGTRLLVPNSRFDAVKRAIVEAMRLFPVGDPADPKTAIGPMVSERQYDRVQSYIRKGIEEGAEVLVGGEGRPKGLEAGFFVKPTVFRPGGNIRPRTQCYRLRHGGRRNPHRQRHGLRPSCIRERRRPRACAACCFPDPCRARRDQRHARRPAGAVRRIQTLRCRPRIRHLRNRSVSRTARHSGVSAGTAPRKSSGETVSNHTAISPNEAADRLAIRELVDTYARCADRRDAKGQMSLFTADTHFVVYMDAKDPSPSQELHNREALAPVFADLNKYDATTHFIGQSSILSLTDSRATGETYCLAHHVTVHGQVRRLMVASLRYRDTFIKIDGAWLFAERLLYVDWVEERALS